MSISKFNCNYDHSFNPFNMEHKLNGNMILDKTKLNFDLDFSSSLFSIYDFTKVDMKICANSNIFDMKNIKKELKKN